MLSHLLWGSWLTVWLLAGAGPSAAQRAAGPAGMPVHNPGTTTCLLLLLLLLLLGGHEVCQRAMGTCAHDAC